jgi:hypothetical protein
MGALNEKRCKTTQYIRIYPTMPTRYTFEQVKNTFVQSGCTLLEETYLNQLEKLKYIVSCGHENTTSFKQILKGSGIKCDIHKSL